MTYEDPSYEKPTLGDLLKGRKLGRWTGNNKVLSVQIPEDMYEAIRAKADKQGLSVSHYVRDALASEL